MANEKRLIDANALDAQIEKLAKKYESRGRLEAAKDYRFVQTVLQCAPTVDAVEVVRCKDCKWSRTNTNDHEDVYYCELRTGRAYHSGDFCSHGERREE